MTSSRYPQITDELLSAYIDDMVTEDEKALIETALLAEPEVAWRLETLRYTVNLLHTLPTMALPRSFTLSEIQMTSSVIQPTASVAPPVVGRVRQPHQERGRVGGLEEWWQNFWQFGNLFLRNAAAASLAIFLVLSISNFVIANRTSPVLQIAAPARYASEALPTAIAEAPKPTMMATATPSVASAQDQNQALAQQTIAVQAEAGAAANENQNPPSTTFAKPLVSASVASAQPESPVAQASTDVVRSAARAPGPAGGAAGANELAPDQPNTDNAHVAISNGAAPAIAAAKVQTTSAYSSDGATSQVQASAAMTAPQSLTQATTAMTTTAALSVTQTPTIVNTPTVSAAGRADNNTTSASPTPPPNQAVSSEAQQPLAEGGQRSLLQLAQLVSALVTLVFAVLWWRSRTNARQLLD
ncbi:MAG: hypothetical protein U0350_46505 [Caldilineaceae bacterium]